ncbi:cation-transporting P-type ATPase [Rhizomonospora bruguierae]|uniref:cation-transporting P-type ATPase n=1 Tax=Rhizomonospora bruguierae TaxID=1581705 RepID=UPI001BCC48E7|nr:cation-transporting P-type ATPase [Micromonospora sp. NBRC 107566]
MAADHESTGPAGAFWSTDPAELLRGLGTDGRGLPAAEAAQRLRRTGPNRVEAEHRHRGLRLLLAQFTSPIILILTAATVVSMALGDVQDGVIILAIILASGSLGFWQERTAGRAVDALLARVQVRVEAWRDGREVSVPVEEVVPGDLLVLRTNRPFYRSRPASRLLLTSLSLVAVTIAVPYTPIGRPLGLTGLRPMVLAALAALTVLYVAAAEVAKRRFRPDRDAAAHP